MIFNFEAERKSLLANLKYLKSLPVKEFTLRKKWDEMVTTEFSDRSKIIRASDGIWTPSNLQDEGLTVQEITDLNPKVVLCTSDALKEWWNIYRLFGSSAEYNQIPARTIRYLVIHQSEKQVCDEIPGKVLGVGSIGSDVSNVTCRDEYIGWTHESRFDEKKLRNTAIGSTIVATHPFGGNFLGGKLIAALTTSKILQDQWKTQYGDVLAGLTTTSLYGPYSMYNSLKWWRPMGTTAGAVAIRPDNQIWSKWRRYAKEILTEEFDEAEAKRHTQLTALIFKVAKIRMKDFEHGHERGVYFSSIYENTNDFLCGRIGEHQLRMKPLFQGDVDAILKYWKPKAIERYRRLKKEGRLNPNTLFYKEGYRMDWETFSKVWLNRM